MYSQYQQFQQQHHGGTTTSVQQPGMTWNGSSWVPAAAAATATATLAHQAAAGSGYQNGGGYSQYSTPTYSSQQQQSQQKQPPVLPPNPVQTYTRYYHEYTAKLQEQQAIQQDGSQFQAVRDQAQQHAAWYKYHADQSSRAAHHFHQNPAALTAPFELPPAPQSAATATSAATASAPGIGHAAQQSQQTQSQHRQDPRAVVHVAPSPKASKSSAPDSLQRYVDGCLKQCSTPAEKTAVMKQVHQEMAKAMKEGKLHSTNWDQVPLVPVPGRVIPATNTSTNTAAATNGGGGGGGGGGVDNHYGPPLTSATMNTAATNSSAVGAGGHNGYYAPSTSFSTTTPSSHGGGNHYGPLTTTVVVNANSSSVGGAGVGVGSSGGNYYGASSSAAAASTPVQDFTSGSSYYGPASDHKNTNNKWSKQEISNNNSGSGKKKQKAKQNKKQPAALAANGSYYGPVSSSPFSLSSSSSNPLKNQQQAQAQLGMDDGFIPFNYSSNNNNNSNSGKKRKMEHKDSGFNETSKSMQDRAKRFSGPGGLTDASATPKSMTGFDKYMGKETIGGGSKTVLTDEDYEQMTVKGTSNKLEKEYLRLTAPPRAELVRPQAILKEHMLNLKAERERTDRREYNWFCSQLKAVRQDCRVQRVVNAFTVDVYETHARIALLEGDLNEYNQCQTQLKELYEFLKDDEGAVTNHNEFVAYRLLYYVLLGCNQKYEGGSSDLFQLMLSLSPEQKQDPAVRHALKVRESVADWDYHLFFGLYKKSPNLGVHLMDRIVPHMRHTAMQIICRAYRPAVETDFCLQEVGLDGNLEFGRIWLASCGCVLSKDGGQIETKDSVVHESDLEEKQSLI
jgi:hypothetical protein